MFKRISLATVSLVSLVSCGGGFDSLSDIPLAGGSFNSHVSTPDTKSKWKYGSTDIDGEVSSKTATIYAINTYRVSKSPNIDHRPWVKLEKRKMADKTIAKKVDVYALEAVKCTPSCDIKFSFNGQATTYRMQQTTDGVLTPINTEYENSLFDIFTQSNKAVISLPLVDLVNPFEAEFDLRGYDKEKMKLGAE